MEALEGATDAGLMGAASPAPLLTSPLLAGSEEGVGLLSFFILCCAWGGGVLLVRAGYRAGSGLCIAGSGACHSRGL